MNSVVHHSFLKPAYSTFFLVVHTFPDPTYILYSGWQQMPKEISLLKFKIRMVQENSIDMQS